tara:strand:- start:280 stop:507 length:228 start_codon:yes stop_codon:yes gene_type:complete
MHYNLKNIEGNMYTYKLAISETATTWGNGNAAVRLEITNTATGKTKVCDDFTYLEDDTQENLEWLFDTDFGTTLH